MARALYVTHPEVLIDPMIPTPLWALSPEGRARAEAFATRNPLPPGTVIFSSTERKAMDLAEILAARSGAPIIADAAFCENDRTATGFLPPELFEATADRFFAEPQASIDGWERAADAQARILGAARIAIDSLEPNQFAVFAGHGAVGTLLKCHCGNRPIARAEDQRRNAHPGGGNCFLFDLDPPRLHCDWTSMEDFALEALSSRQSELAMAP